MTNASAELTSDEANVVRLLADVWNTFMDLPVEHAMDRDEFCRAVHVLQEKVLARPGRRAFNALTVPSAPPPSPRVYEWQTPGAHGFTPPPPPPLRPPS